MSPFHAPRARRATLALVALIVSACGGGGPAPDEAQGEPEPTAPTNRIDIPASVRANLGVTFVGVERRRVAATLRVPGRFEYVPTARTEYRASVPGRIDLEVEELERVEQGARLYVIDSHAWRDHQRELSDTAGTIARLMAEIETFGPLRVAHEAHAARLEGVIEVRAERIAQLEEVASAGGGRRAQLLDARSELAAAEAALTEVRERDATLDAEESRARVDLVAARGRMALLLEAASALAGASVEELQADVDGAPRWRGLRSLEVHADAAGVVEALNITDGAWAAEGAAVVTLVRPDRLRFHARGLQSDLALLRSGLPGRIVPPRPTASDGAVALTDAMPGVVALGLGGDPDARTVDLYVTPDALASWARPGVSAQLEVTLDPDAPEALAVPLAAVQRDGLRSVLFKRATDDPDQAVRVEADLGRDDGRWVEVLSGFGPGDEVVLDGAFQLMLATSQTGASQKGGHFHADGTYHEGED